MKILKIIEIQTFIEYLFCIEFLVEFLHFFRVRSYTQLQDFGFFFSRRYSKESQVMTTLQVFSAVTGDLILQTELPEEEIFLHLSDRICAATGVPNFCQQLMSQDGDIIRDWKAWDQLGQPLNLQVAFQMATKSLSHELLEFSSTGDHDKVQEILQQFQDPNVVDPAGESPMVKVRGHFF